MTDRLRPGSLFSFFCLDKAAVTAVSFVLAEYGVLQENFRAQKYEDSAAQTLGFRFEPTAEDAADLYAQRRDHERGETYARHGDEEVHPEKGEGNSDGQRVDAGGDGHGKHGLEAEGIAQRLFFFSEGLLDHVQSDQQQKDEGDPVVHRGYVFGKSASEKVTDGRHERLKPAEPDSGGEHVFSVGFFHRKPLTDRDSKSIH